jgi:hypothetical protein
MRDTMRRLPIAAGTLIASLALPAAALAQQQLEPIRVTAVATARADAMHAKAEAMDKSSLRAFGKMAHLHEKSAGLRGADDPQRVECLKEAAFLRYGTGDLRRAGDDMERAAQLAAARGDVMTAATAYTDAAYIAAYRKQPERTVEFTSAAQLLSASPLLSAAQRMELLNRLPHRSDVALLERPSGN